MKYFLLVGIVAVAACSRGPAEDTRVIQLSDGGPVLETVNGTPVPKSLLEAVADAQRLDLGKPPQRERAMKLLTDYVLMAQQARRQNMFADTKFRAGVEVARLQAIAEATITDLEQQTQIADSVLKAQYDAEAVRAGKVSYDFSQLLFDNQDDALKAEGDVISGMPFEKVVRKWHEKAKQTKSYSRVLRDQVPEALAGALASLKNGETTKVPIKTEFGYHVVHLDIANPYSPPPFDQVKEGIRRTMLARVGQQRLAKLREQAKVEYAAGVTPPAAAAATRSGPDAGAGDAAHLPAAVKPAAPPKPTAKSGG